MKVDVLRPSDARWLSMLSRCAHDFYHLPGYLSLSETTDGGEAVALLATDGEHSLLLPLLLRNTPDARHRDASSPYGYPGPVFTRDAPPSFQSAALAAVTDALRGENIISLFVRMHPLLNRDLREVSVGALLAHGETVHIDLSLDPEALWSQTRSGHRNEINRALRAGHDFELDSTWSDIEGVSALYLDTMERVGARDYYLFPRSYFERLREALGPHGMLATVRIEGELAAGAVFTEIDGRAQYHLSGSALKFRKQQPTKLMLHEMRLHGHREGWEWLHLGGGAGSAEDSLFKFKAGFSPARSRFHSWRAMLDPIAYRHACEARHGANDESDESTSLDGFFPRYRAPVETD